MLLKFLLKSILPLFLFLMTGLTGVAQKDIYRLTTRQIDSVQRLNGTLKHTSNGTMNRGSNRGTNYTRPLFRFSSSNVVSAMQQNLGLGAVLQSNCIDTSSRFFLQKDSCFFYVFDCIRARDGNLLLSGEYNKFANDILYAKGFLMKCTENGMVLWARLYDSINPVRQGDYISYYQIAEKQDGSIMLGGVTNNFVTGNQDLIITKTDNSGNLTWSKIYKSRLWTQGSGSADYYYLQQMTEDPETGNIFITGPHWTEGRSVTEIDAMNGNIIWSKLYQPPFESFFDFPLGFDIRGNDLTLYGRFLTNYDSYISVYKLNKLTGDTIQSRFYSFGSSNQWKAILNVGSLAKLSNGNCILKGGAFNYYRNPYDPGDTLPLYLASVIEFKGLNFENAFSFRNNAPSNSSNTKVSVFPDGSGLFTMLNYISPYSANVYYVHFKGSDILKQRIKNYNGEGIPYEPESLPIKDGTLSIKLIGDSIGNSGKVEFLKLHLTDTSSQCLGTEDHSTFTTPFSLQPIDASIDSIGDHVFEETTNKTLGVEDATLTLLPGCRQLSFCDFLSVSSSAPEICVSDSLLLTVHKNRECGAPVFFNFDSSSLASIVQLNDSVYSFKFNSSWKGKIYAHAYGCSLLTDSVNISVLQSPATLDLGKDTVLCKGQTILLNAGTGFSSYLWNNGTTDSTYSVTAPGKYFVKTTNACGGEFTDSIIFEPPCDSFSVSASSREICLADSLLLTIHKSPQCHAPVYFNFDSTSLQSLVALNDSVFRFKFYSAWEGTIYAHTYGCTLLTDSTSVSVLNPPTTLDAGPDTVLCPGNTIILHAGGGFSSYLWSDGSSDSVLTVTVPGKYRLKTTNACGSSFIDTVIVLSHPPIAFDAGPDLSKCNNDSIFISLPGGFISYLWTPSVAISSDTASSVIVSTAVTTVYKIRAEKSRGCFAYDSIKITVHTSPAIDLGKDQSLCFGDTLALDAGKGFIKYVWNTGDVSEKIAAFQKGSYSVMGTTKDGCRSLDTLTIQNMFDNPQVTLDKDTTLCMGSVRKLDAGNFSNFQWNTGETTRAIEVKQTGGYAVTVIDIHGCKGADSVDINTALDLPGNFLPADTAICSYGEDQISSTQNYLNYLWNTGAAGKSITVSKPGVYWLAVTDKNNCEGRDSINIIPKNCMSGFYIPNAFTPNDDGRNDTFKPLLFGNILHYEFAIYNRFGQKIFITNKINEGWNGMLENNPQDSHIFVWVCRYQFSGEKEIIKKGTVVLMR